MLGFGPVMPFQILTKLIAASPKPTPTTINPLPATSSRSPFQSHAHRRPHLSMDDIEQIPIRENR